MHDRVFISILCRFVITVLCLHFPGSLGQFDNKLIEHAHCQVFGVVCGSWFGNLFIVSNISSAIFTYMTHMGGELFFKHFTEDAY